MIKKLGTCLMLTSLVMLATAQSAAAQQTLNFTLGYFSLRGEDARVEGDTLNANLHSGAPLVYEISDFNGATVGAEWLIPLGNYFEAGAGIAFSRRTVPSIYDGYEETDGSEIEQDLRLRIVPVSFTIRVLPLGQSSPVQPYFGAGLGIFNWRYSETGDFIDFDQGRPIIFPDTFVDSGSTTGPVALGGIRFVSDTMSAGGEIRYQSADADLSDGFLGSKIDLGGWTYQFTVGVRFGR
jgi:hypothetical protein